MDTLPNFTRPDTCRGADLQALAASWEANTQAIDPMYQFLALPPLLATVCPPLFNNTFQLLSFKTFSNFLELIFTSIASHLTF
jgi:hypothetical protein